MTSNTAATMGDVIKEVAEASGLKTAVIRTVFTNTSAIAAQHLRKHGAFRVPYLGKATVKKIPSKKYPAGDYTNPFTKITAHKDAWVRPARMKLKFNFASTVKESVVK